MFNAMFQSAFYNLSPGDRGEQSTALGGGEQSIALGGPTLLLGEVSRALALGGCNPICEC